MIKQGSKVIVKWIGTKERATATVKERIDSGLLILVFSHDPKEEYEFERYNGQWFEVNNMTVPVTIEEKPPITKRTARKSVAAVRASLR